MEKSMKKVNLKMLTEAGIMIALAMILNSIKLYKFTQGGSITPGGYVPLLIFALRWGPKKGIGVGIVYGLLDFLIDPYMVHPVQFLLDYPLAYGMLGLAGFAKNSKEFNDIRSIVVVTSSVIIACFLRMMMAVLSGVIFFKEFLPQDIPYVLGSLIYNLSYTLPNTLISLILIILILPRLKGISKW